MRIGAGTLRGRSLRVPGGTRPTGARAREALFDIWGPRLGGGRLLDLFAGAGAIGIEALSRGAASVLAIEGARAALGILRSNYRSLLPGGGWKVRRLQLPEGLADDAVLREGPFDLVFADPPYDFEPWATLLERVEPMVAEGGEVGVEHGRRNRPPSQAGGLERVSRRAYGETEISFYRRG